MPRLLHETLYGYQMGVEDTELPVTGSDGQPVFGMDGQPRTEPCKQLVFASPFDNHRVDIPLSEDARSKLVELLTGGVTVPKLEVAGAGR